MNLLLSKTLICIGLSILCIAASTTALAATYNYGAIAFDKSTRSFGYSFNHVSREAAEADAVRRCPTANCPTVMWFANGCGALAANDVRYGGASAATRAEAIQKATSQCGYSDCKVLAVSCTDRRSY